MLLTDIENAARQDLFDPAGSSQRWATSDIDRAIDTVVRVFYDTHRHL